MENKELIKQAEDKSLLEIVNLVYVAKGTKAFKTKEWESDVAMVKYEDVEKIFNAFKEKVKELSKKRMRWYKVLSLIAIGLVIGAAAGCLVGYYYL